MDKKVLVIGNGFDLDLGLKTSYSSFLNSDFFNQLRYKYQMIEYLCESRCEKKWIDIEESLKKFAIRHGRDTGLMKESKEAYELLTKALTSYLDSIDYSTINKKSIASNLFNNIVQNGYFEILNFNYTNIKKIKSALGIHTNIKYKHVHGSLENNSIILGFEDNVNVLKSCYFMIKSHNSHYSSCNIRVTLEQANEIVFFGHSLGCTDYHYFSDFFKVQSGLKENEVKNKKIRIFTYDEDSRLRLLEQLREMNEQRINYLYDLNDLKFYRTSDPNDLEEIQKYYYELQICSRKVHDDQLRSFTNSLI